MDIKILYTFPMEVFSWSDKRITQAAYDFYKQGRADNTIIIGMFDGDKIIGASAVVLDKVVWKWVHGITIVNPEYRGKGVGVKLIKHKAKLQKIACPGVIIETLVGSKNVKSIKMCLKAGFKLVNANERYTNSGKTYVALKFVL